MTDIMIRQEDNIIITQDLISSNSASGAQSLIVLFITPVLITTTIMSIFSLFNGLVQR